MKKAIVSLFFVFLCGCLPYTYLHTPESIRQDKNHIVTERVVCGDYQVHYREIVFLIEGNLPTGFAIGPAQPGIRSNIFPDNKTALIWFQSAGYMIDMHGLDGNATKFIARTMDYRYFRDVRDSVNKHLDEYQSTNCDR